MPKILAIQLKRFDYDWEREIAVKSNEYFEFPRELDMEPYTVRGVARIEQEQLHQQQKLRGQKEKTNSQAEESEMPLDKLKLTETEGGMNAVVSENEGESSGEEDEEESMDSGDYSNNYKLVGIVVHSGQANGGHYYSFIQNKATGEEDEADSEVNSTDSENNW